MVKINIDNEKSTLTTKNIGNITFDERVVSTKDSKLKFYFKDKEPYLSVDEIEYPFDSSGSTLRFLQKLFLNSTVVSNLSNDTLVIVANEILQNMYHGHMPTINLVITKSTNRIFTITSMSADLVSWDKIMQAVYEVFAPLEEKKLHIYLDAGLDISIVMNDDFENLTNEDYLDVVRISAQTSSSISIFRGNVRRQVPLRGYDENEILGDLKRRLKEILSVSPALVKG